MGARNTDSHCCSAEINWRDNHWFVGVLDSQSNFLFSGLVHNTIYCDVTTQNATVASKESTCYLRVNASAEALNIELTELSKMPGHAIALAAVRPLVPRRHPMLW